MNDTESMTVQPVEAHFAEVEKTRGRPKLNVDWPDARFTFNSLVSENKTLSSSSLRKKMRVELTKGALMKVGTLKTAFGRPQNIYKKS
jgi:hypothetical protein